MLVKEMLMKSENEGIFSVIPVLQNDILSPLSFNISKRLLFSVIFLCIDFILRVVVRLVYLLSSYLFCMLYHIHCFAEIEGDVLEIKQ